MVNLEKNKIEFRFPNVHKDAFCSIGFQRTLRIPDDNREYPLPPGLGKFPLFHVEDYSKQLPEQWNSRGGCFLPMYQSEALWINFSGQYPCAIKIASGKINAVTGEAWSNEINETEQDYVVIPGQPWLDGFCVQKGLIRQFVAMPLGEGYTAEEQITGEAEFGGLQVIVYPMKAECWEELVAKRGEHYYDDMLPVPDVCYSMEPDMGLAPGGLMRQEIYDDQYGFDSWQTDEKSRCYIHLANSLKFQDITGNAPPTEPPSAEAYTRAGLPWFEYYGYEKKVLEGSSTLAELHSIAAMQVQKGQNVLGENKPVSPSNVKTIGHKPNTIKNGEW